jgi:hypothetical protein
MLPLSNDILGAVGGAGLIAILVAYALLVLGALISSLTAGRAGRASAPRPVPIRP